MEFFPTTPTDGGDAGAAQRLFEGDSLVVPAVSFANLGQLTVDLVVNTLLQRGQECDAAVEKVGHLFSTAVPPIAGAAAYGSQDRSALCVNLEVFRIPSRRVTLIQQRTDVAKGKARVFANELVAWATASGFASLVVVAGADDMLRHDPNMLRRPLHTISFADQDKSVCNSEFLKATQSIETADAQAWEDFRGVGIAPLLHAKCATSAAPLSFVSFLLSCSEGDNVPDAVAMASHLLHYLEIKLPQPPAPPSLGGTPLPPPPPFVFPPSWSQLFGRGPDAALFL